MGKPKKANRDNEHDDLENDEVATDATETQNTTQPSSKGDKKKKAKKNKQKDDDWDDIEAEMQGLSVKTEEEEPEESIPVVSKKSKVKTKGVSAFALLADLDDADVGGDADDDDQSNKKSDNEDVNEDKEETVIVQKSKKKEKSKKEKPKKQEEEDIDAILANIENPTKAEKKKKKKNKVDNDEDAVEEDGDKPVEEVERTEAKVVSIDDLDDEFEDDKKKRKKNKKKGKEEDVQEEKKEDADGETKDDEGEVGEDGEVTMKTAAQKKKEKKEREKQKKMEEKQKQLKKEQAKKEKEAQDSAAAGEKAKEDGEGSSKKKDAKAAKEAVPKPEGAGAGSHEATPDAEEGGEGDENKEKEGKKKKKKKADKEKEKEEPKEEKGKPKNKQLAALKEALKQAKEEEERAKEEEERFKQSEVERIRLYEEELKRKEELKRIKKQEKKDREAQLKKEGKFLTEKQKQDQKKLEQMLAAMKLSGVVIEPKASPEGTTKRGMVYKKKKQTGNKEKSPSTVTSPTEESPKTETSEGLNSAKKEAEKKVVEEVVKDDWDADSEEEEEEEKEDDSSKSSAPASATPEPAKTKEEEVKEDEEDDDEEEESSEESESESESDGDEKTPSERGRDKIQKRMEKAEKARTVDYLRAPVVCVLGHVDTGKTKILDKLRRTNVQDGEAGGITQQIGATNVPRDALIEKTKMVKEFAKQELKIPGLLIIDTPGHESFSNLRLRGSSLCDIAILVIDIMHGLEPQTIESIKLLKDRKTPFLVALNKIDRLYQWKPQPMADVQNTLKKQTALTKSEFDERTEQVKLQLAEEGLNATLFFENKNPREYVSLVPTSAHSGDGMGNLVALVCELCQTMLAKRLMYSTELQATVMEVKAITGMGTTIDVILINGSLNEGDTIVLAGTEGPIITQIRGLLMPQPMKELRVKNQYEHHKTVLAAQGVKINAKEMEKCLAGLPLYVARDNDEKEYYTDEVALVLKDTLESIKVQDRGVFVQASTLGSLEALLDFLRTSKIPFAGINIGPVHKKDIMRASVMLEHDSQYAVILAFDVKVEREAQEMADTLGVRVFTAEIIYHLFDAFMKYREDLKKQKQEEFKNIAVFPCKLRILPQYIFNSRDPIVMGVVVESGFVKEGTPICVPTKEFVDIGRVASLELNHKNVDSARQGQEICIKIVPTPGDTPKMFGRHFEETDLLVSKISRESIDAVKDYFREEMTKPDWRLMVELKKQFGII